MNFSMEWLYGTSLAIIWPASVVLLVACAAAGRAIGRWRAAKFGAAPTQSIGVLESAALGLVTLMLSFTFSAALDRYDARKALVVAEANTLSSAQQWARMLPSPHAAVVDSLLGDYLRVRMSMDQHAAGGLARIADPTVAVQTRLWAEAVAANALDPRSIPIGQFTQSLSHLIDIHEERLAAESNHVPEAVFLLLYALAGVALGFNGFRAGLGGDKSVTPSAIMVVLFATVIAQAQDLDRPQRGFIVVSQQPITNINAAADPAH